MKKKIINFTILTFLLLSTSINAQIIVTENTKIPSNNSNVYAGIEISTKAVKISVLELLNANRGEYNVISSWNENTSVGAGISINKTINEDDIDKTAQIVQKSYQRLIKDFKISQKKIFVVISSGVGIAKNVTDLKGFIETLIQKKVSIIDFEAETKFLIKGSIPVNNYDDAMVFDIGGGNAKGGIVTKLVENKSYVFNPVGLNIGTVTLTDKIKNKLKKNFNISDYLSLSEKYNDSIKGDVYNFLDKNNLIQTRKNIYVSGGTVWAFMTLTKEKSTEKFVEFKLQDVKNYSLNLFLNYKKFENRASFDKESETVLKTYSQFYLISGNNILINFLENIQNLDQKKIYFVNQGYVSWLKSYILETVNSKIKY
jgi:exopolyphosphatase/pppGpp-phosphohydrolase